MFYKAVVLCAGVLGSVVAAQARGLDAKDYALISRCSMAAYVAVGAVESYPNSTEEQDAFVNRIMRHPSWREPGELTPELVEVVSARIAVETLLKAGKNRPGDSRRTHDWFIAQSAASCALAQNGS